MPGRLVRGGVIKTLSRDLEVWIDRQGSGFVHV